jgi:pyruvate dehydrogenase E2 component (dihydrolipoamide acetyltransferase)
MRGEADKKGVKLTFLPFLLKACAKVLQEYPQFNVSLHSSGEYLIQKHYIHIGIAVATEAGLMVPVLRDVDKKSIWELAAEVITLSDKAKNRRLTKDEMQGACFGKFEPRQMLPLALSYDHRAVNGLDGGLFATYLAKLLGDIRLLVL